MIKLSPFTIRPLKSMRTEIITLCLNQIGRQKVRSQRMEIIERRGKCRYSHPFTDSRSHHSTPCRQSLPDLRGEGWEQHQIPSSSPCLLSPGKFVQKSRPNNTASPPHSGYHGQIQVPPKLFGSSRQQIKPLSISH